MRKWLNFGVWLLVAAPAAAGQPFALDRNGVFWQAAPSPEGLAITGQQNGTELVRGFVPTPPIGGLKVVDKHVAMAVDPGGHEVVVVWQRSWGRDLSEVLLARWSATGEGAVMRLSGPLSNAARHPALRVQQVKWNEADEQDPEIQVARQETLVHVVWWEDGPWGSGARYVWLSLATPAAEQTTPVVLVLQHMANENPSNDCEEELPIEVREYPLFVADPAADSLSILYATGRCRMALWRVGAEALEPLQIGGNNFTGSAQRRRARPIFGSREDVPGPPIDLPVARALSGSDRTLLLYTLDEERRKVAFTMYQNGRWAAPRFVLLSESVTPERLLPILESLAH